MAPANGNGNGNGKAASLQAISIIITVAMGVVSVVGALSLLFINGQIGDVRSRAIENRATIEKDEDQARFDFREVDTRIRETPSKEEVERIRVALMGLRADSVTMDAHNAVLDRVTRLEATIGDITPVGDVLKSMQDQIKTLQNQTYMRDRQERIGPPN